MEMAESTSDQDPVEEMAAFYSPATGTVFHIDAHKRSTAKLLASRYDSKRGFEATTWSRKDVAVMAANEESADEVRSDVPDAEIVAEMEVGTDGE